MWSPSLPYWEFDLRGVVVYFFLLALLRLTGKRQVGQLSPFALVLLLLSNAVQNSMIGGDDSLTGGLVSALALVLVRVDWCVGLVTARSKTAESWVEGRPQVLVHNGVLFEDETARAAQSS